MCSPPFLPRLRFGLTRRRPSRATIAPAARFKDGLAGRVRLQPAELTGVLQPLDEMYAQVAREKEQQEQAS